MSGIPLTLILQDFLPGEGTGIGRYCDNLLREFRGRGLGFTERRFSTRDFRWGPLRIGYYQRIAWQRATVHPSGVVHTMYLLVIPRNTKIATVWDTFHMRGPWPRHPGARWVRRGVVRNLTERPDVWVAISNSVREDLHELLGVSRSRTVVAPPGVDTTQFQPMAGPRPAAMGADGKTTVMHIGLAYKRKGIDLLVEALGRLGAGRFRLVRVGPERDASYADAYRVRARGLGLELTECGVVPDAVLPAYYAHADLLAFPSLDEGAGIPPLEAMACGTNVVASDIPAHRETCGGLAFYAPLNPEGIASAIEQALSHPHGRDELRRHASQFSWRKTAETYLGLYAKFGVL